MNDIKALIRTELVQAPAHYYRLLYRLKINDQDLQQAIEEMIKAGDIEKPPGKEVLAYRIRKNELRLRL